MRFRPRSLTISFVIANLVLLLGSATRAHGVTLFLQEGDPQNLTSFFVVVRVTDGFTEIAPIQEFVWLADGGNGTLELEQFGILEPKYALKEFGFQYEAGNFFESVVTTPSGDIPISVTIDEARWHLRNADSSPISGLIEIGSINAFSADELVADFRGNVTFDGVVFPFDFYDPVWNCGFGVCIDNVDGDPRIFFDAIDSVEITGTRQNIFPPPRSGFPFRIEQPPGNGESLGEVGGLFVRVTIGAINVERLTYIPEPSALTALGSGIAMLALLYRRRRHSVER